MTYLSEQTHEIKLPVYGFIIQFVKTKSIYESRNQRSVEIGEIVTKEYCDTLSALMSCCHSKPLCFVFFTDSVKVGEVAHECWHVVFQIMDWIGATIEDEVCAYLLDYLVEEAWAFVKD